MKFNITAFHFRELFLKGYSLDHIFLLKMMHEQFDISSLVKDSAKIAALQQSLIRKGLITETEDKLTTLGTELLVFMDTKEPKKIERKKVDNSKFKEFWKCFPGTNNFTHAGHSFIGERSLRISENDCRLKFDSIILEGEYSADELIEALNLHIHKIKEVSVKSNINKLTYLHNSLTYLNQRDYQPFIELIKQGATIQETEIFKNGTDI